MSVRNWLVSNHEKIQYISPDGVSYNLHDPAKKSIIQMEGWGMPAAEIAETRGPFQHGSDPLTIRMPKREIVMSIRHNGCNRNEYWSNREGLIDALRLNRTSLNNPSPGKLKWYRADGKIRQADVLIIQGPKFNPSTSGWDEYNYMDELRFLAHNPILYDPRQVTASFDDLGCTVTEQLIFPFTFSEEENIEFGGSSCNAVNELIVNYEGNWQEYPYIEVYGPASNFTITHTQTGLKIELENYTILEGDKVIFDLLYGRKFVTLFSTGANLLGYISEDSDLGNFAIEPHPVVTDGINTFSVSINDGTAATQVVFQYYNRFIGI